MSALNALMFHGEYSCTFGFSRGVSGYFMNSSSVASLLVALATNSPRCCLISGSISGPVGRKLISVWLPAHLASTAVATEAFSSASDRRGLMGFEPAGNQLCLTVQLGNTKYGTLRSMILSRIIENKIRTAAFNMNIITIFLDDEARILIFYYWI